ncbi:MAG: hypothetical protein K2X02_09725 [Alphaproteobacteria bacterium]|nr:hypothetical protein [Alphaproteobacteria bacterium]
MNTYRKRNFLSFLILICCTFFSITPSYGGLEEDDYDIYRGKRKFGTLHGQDLDAIHEELATCETIVSNKTSSQAKNNIVFGALSLVLKNGDSSRVVTINLSIDSPDGQSSKRKVFESTSTYTLYKDNTLSQSFSFDKEAPSIAILSDHVGEIWGDRGEDGHDWIMKPSLLVRERYIWDDFEYLRRNLEISKENLRSSLTKTALEISSMCFPLSSLALTLEIKDRPFFTQLSIFQQQQGKDGSPSGVLNSLQEMAERKKKELKKAEDDLKQKTNKFYVYFGHSEQKMLNFLLDDECGVFDELIGLIREETVEGALLHVHSRYNFCQTCRRALIRTSAFGGALRTKLEDRIGALKSASFYCKVLASFRVMYNPGVWMSYKVTDDDAGELSPEDLTSNVPHLFLSKITRGTSDEILKDKEYEASKGDQAIHTPYTFQSGVLVPPIAASSSTSVQVLPFSSSSSSQN